MCVTNQGKRLSRFHISKEKGISSLLFEKKNKSFPEKVNSNSFMNVIRNSQVSSIKAQSTSKTHELKHYNYADNKPCNDKSQYRHIVTHSYHDHSQEVEDRTIKLQQNPSLQSKKGGVTVTFPMRLHQLLDEIDRDGLSSIVSWQPHGRCFLVHKPKEFVSRVLPTYFNQSKIGSFQRQLNLYGFRRLSGGRDKGAYYHENFLRGMPFLVNKIQRTKVKGTFVRGASNPDTEPNFYSMPWLQIKTEKFNLSKQIEEDDDCVLSFEGKKFHYIAHLDSPSALYRRKFSQVSFGESIYSANDFFKDIDSHDLDEILSDTQLGDLLERMIQ